MPRRDRDGEFSLANTKLRRRFGACRRATGCPYGRALSCFHFAALDGKSWLRSQAFQSIWFCAACRMKLRSSSSLGSSPRFSSSTSWFAPGVTRPHTFYLRLSLSTLVVLVAFFGGGIGLFAAIWLVVVPLEAALCGSRRVVLISAALSMAAGLLLLMLSMAGSIRPNSVDMHESLAALAIVSALLYATGLAFGAVSLVRTGAQLLGEEEDRYRLLVGNMTDVIVRCNRSGSVIFASPAAEPLFGVPTTELAGNKLFERVQVADRPAFLATLADAASSGDVRSLEFRIQRNVGAGVPASLFGSKCDAGRSDAHRPAAKK